MQPTMKFLIFFALICVGFVNAQVGYPYNDQKQNCSASNIKGSYCYNGPRMDDWNQQWKSCAVPGNIALTFDDGPSQYTPIILDVLKQYNMKATFFLIGLNIINYPSIVQRIVDEGHQIGAHTLTHPYLAGMTSNQVSNEILGFERVLSAYNFGGDLAGQVIPNYMRAPHGIVDTVSYQTILNTGYTPIHWSFLSGDSYNLSFADLFMSIYNHFYDGTNVNPNTLTPIIQQHDAQVNTSLAFPQIASYLYNTFGSQGTRFVTISDCLGLGIPRYRPNPRPVVPDPACQNGLLKSSNGIMVCCSTQCGTCGGDMCSSRPGGSINCCGNNIVASQISCQYSSAPCVLGNVGVVGSGDK